MKPDETPMENAEKQAKTYAIFKETAERMNIADIGKTVAKEVRLPLADVTTRLFACSGFIADNLTEIQKDQICELLQETGVSYFVVEQKDVLQLPELETVETGAFDSCGFQFTSAGETTTYTWNNILLVNAARFETVSQKLVTKPGSPLDDWVLPGDFGIMGIPVRIRRKKRVPEFVKKIIHRLAIDVFVKEPPGRFRLLDQVKPFQPPDQSAAAAELGRFRALAQNIVQFATDTFVGDAVKVLAEGGDLSKFTYDARRKFDLLNFYLLNLAQHLKQNGE